MLRLIVRESDVGDAANVGGPVLVRYKTFDVQLPQIEELLRLSPGQGWARYELIGAEILEQSP